MKLSEWQKRKRTTNVDLARIVGVHRSYICHINARRRIPSAKIALAIEKATNGQVTKEELLWPDAN